MAVRHFSASGTRSSGNSTPDDWTNANCYAFSTIKTNGTNWALSTGDEIIIDDGAHTIDFLQTAASGAASGSLITIRSRSGDPDLCSIDCNSGSGTLFRFNHASKVLSAYIYGIKIKKTTTHTVNGAALVHLTGATSGDVEFENCKFDSASLSAAGTGLNGFFSILDGISATLRFTGCQMSNMTSSTLSGLYFGYIGTLGTMVFADCDISDITHNTTGTAHHCTGGVQGPGGLVVINSSLTDCSSTSATNGEYDNAPFFHPGNACTIMGLTSTRVTNTGAKSGATIALFKGPWTVSDTLSIDCVGTPAFINGVDGETQNTVGGTFTAFGEAAQGTATRIRAIRCKSDFGTTWYCSQGAGGVITDLISEYCTARKEGAGVYAGGWGDVTVDGFRVIGAVMGLETSGFEGWGGAMYAHNHTNSTRSKTTRYLNGVISGCRQLLDGDSGIKVRGLNETYSHSVEITNVVIDNPGHASQIGLHETAGCALNVSGSGIVLLGGASAITKVRAGIGVDTYAPVSALTTANLPTRWGVSQGNAARRAA